MKKKTQLKTIISSAILATAVSASMMPLASQAGVTANIGYTSNYIFRGVEQTNTGSGSAGLDYENDSGFYAGTWVADVDSGLETDLYAGFGTSFNGIDLGIGATYYGYTEAAFDKPYQEVNLSAGFSGVSFSYDLGQHLKAGAGNKDVDYNHMSISTDYKALSFTLGKYDPDTSASNDANTYLNVGYSTELAKGLDGSVTYTYSAPESSNAISQSFLAFGITKSLDF